MTRYRAGDLVLSIFPFTSGNKNKARPALVVLDSGDNDVLLARITTQPRATPYDVDLSDWRGSGLFCASTIRLHKLFSVEKTQVIRPLGALQPADHQQVSAVLLQMFGNW